VLIICYEDIFIIYLKYALNIPLFHNILGFHVISDDQLTQGQNINRFTIYLNELLKKQFVTLNW